METKTLTQMMSEYRVFTDTIEKMYVEKKMRDSMGGDSGVHMGHIKRVSKLLEDRFVNG
jgi:hypothetical protein